MSSNLADLEDLVAPPRTGPFHTAVEMYRAAGWQGVLALPIGSKYPPPEGFTGAAGRWPTDENVETWRRDGSHNIGLRLPDGVIGIDVDHYGDKRGGDELARLEARLGPLPATWTSTSRPWPSGIRLFAVPTGRRFASAPAPAIEVVQRHHRYLVVWPSIHPEGGHYEWITPDGELADRPPTMDELPELPSAWVEALADDRPSAPPADNPPPVAHREDAWAACVRQRFDQALGDLASGLSRHDVATAAAAALARLESQGHAGATAALDELGHRFTSAVTSAVEGKSQRNPAAAAKEWNDILAGGRVLVRTTAAMTPTVSELAELDAMQQRTLDDHRNGKLVTDTAGAATADSPQADSIIAALRARTLTSAELANLPPPEFLVGGLLPADGISLLYGPAGLGKSVVAVSLSAAIALGRPWCGLETLAAPVLYVVAESPAGMGRRVAAWADRSEIGLSDLDALHWLKGAVNLYDGIQAVSLARHTADLGARLVVIDTLARCTVGAEENSARDMGTVIDNIDRIRAAGAAVLLVHHTGKDVDRGARGSTAIRGALDAEFELSGGKGRLSLSTRKQKDAVELSPIRMRLVPHHDSVVAEHDELQAAGGEAGPFRPTALMEKVSMQLSSSIEGRTKTDLRTLVSGRSTYVDRALEVLVAEGYAALVDGTKRYRILAPYVARDDPASDSYEPGFDEVVSG